MYYVQAWRPEIRFDSCVVYSRSDRDPTVTVHRSDIDGDSGRSVVRDPDSDPWSPSVIR